MAFSEPLAFVTNDLGQRIGQPVDLDLPVACPPRAVVEGRFCKLAPLDPVTHAPQLHAAFSEDTEARDWTYLPYGPFPSDEAFLAWMKATCCAEDPLFFVVVVEGVAVGMASYLRINPGGASIEIGHIHFAPALQRGRAATEAIGLMMRTAFSLGYRRLEWKCDALNGPSRRAALRYGFVYEGVHRQAAVVKGRNRDTAWYSILDHEWPALEAGLDTWLADENFDQNGHQRRGLTDCR